MSFQTPSAALAAQGINTENFAEGRRYRYVTYLCNQMKVDESSLLTVDVTSHTEFMRELSLVAEAFKDYYQLVTLWKQNQSFVKRESKVARLTEAAEKRLSDLKDGLLQLAQLKVTVTSLSAQLRSCHEKLAEITSLLPVLLEAKFSLERCIPCLYDSTRAQKPRKLNKLAGSGDYQLCASNSIHFSWEASLDSLSIIEHSSFVPKPLNLEQLLMFPSKGQLSSPWDGRYTRRSHMPAVWHRKR